MTKAINIIIFIFILFPEVVATSEYEFIKITPYSQYYDYRLRFDYYTTEKNIFILNSTSNFLKFKIDSHYCFYRSCFKGEEVFIIPPDDTYKLSFSTTPKPRKDRINEITVKYIDESNNFHIKVILVINRNEHLTLTDNGKYLQTKMLTFNSKNKLASCTIENLSNKVIYQHNITVKNKLNCFRDNYVPKSLQPNENQVIEFVHLKDKVECNQLCNETFSIVDELHEKKLDIHLKYTPPEKITCSVAPSSKISYEKPVMPFTLVFFIFISIMLLMFFLVFIGIKNFFSTKLRKQKLDHEEPKRKDYSNVLKKTKTTAPQNKKINQLKRLNAEIQKKDTLLTELKRQYELLKEKQKNDIVSTKKEINPELIQFKTELYSTTLEILSSIQNISFSKSESQEWSLDRQKIILKKIINLDEKYQKSNAVKKSLLKMFNPVLDFFNISVDNLNELPTQISNLTLLPYQLQYYEKQDVHTPLFIKHFELYLDMSIEETSCILKNIKRQTRAEVLFEEIHDSLRKFRSIIGSPSNRTNLIKELNFQHPHDIQIITPEIFFNSLILNHFSIFDSIIRLNIYYNTVIKNIDIKKQLFNSNKNEEHLHSLIYSTKFYFQSLFKVKFSEVSLFKEKFNPRKHKGFDENRPIITTLFPETQPLISSIEKNVIIDVFSVGFVSENSTIKNQLPVVVIKI